MKLVELAPIAAGADAEGGAKLHGHVSLIEVAEIRSEERQRVFPAPEFKAEAGQTAKTLKGAERNARSSAKCLREVDGMALRDIRQFQKAPSAARLLANRLDDRVDPGPPVAALLNLLNFPNEFGGEGCHHQLIPQVRGKLERKPVRRNPSRGGARPLRVSAILLLRRKVKIETDGALIAEPVAVCLAGSMREEAAVSPLAPNTAVQLGKAPSQDNTEIVVDMLVGRIRIAAAVGCQADQLAAGRLNGDHVERDPEIKRAGLFGHQKRERRALNMRAESAVVGA